MEDFDASVRSVSLLLFFLYIHVTLANIRPLSWILAQKKGQG